MALVYPFRSHQTFSSINWADGDFPFLSFELQVKRSLPYQQSQPWHVEHPPSARFLPYLPPIGAITIATTGMRTFWTVLGIPDMTSRTVRQSKR